MMDAVEYLKEKQRMCRETKCHDCGIDKLCDVCAQDMDHPEEAVRIVEEWSKAHPRQTNGQKFVEVFGFEPTTWNKMGEEIHDFIADPQWWHEPYEAPKGDNNG